MRDVIRARAVTVSDVYGQRRLDDGRLDVLSFNYRPGKAFAHFLQSEGGRQTALLSAKALKYDTKYHAIEKRLAWFFAYIWRERARPREFFIIRFLSNSTQRGRSRGRKKEPKAH